MKNLDQPLVAKLGDTVYGLDMEINKDISFKKMFSGTVIEINGATDCTTGFIVLTKDNKEKHAVQELFFTDKETCLNALNIVKGKTFIDNNWYNEYLKIVQHLIRYNYIINTACVYNDTIDIEYNGEIETGIIKRVLFNFSLIETLKPWNNKKHVQILLPDKNIMVNDIRRFDIIKL